MLGHLRTGAPLALLPQEKDAERRVTTAGRASREMLGSGRVRSLGVTRDAGVRESQESRVMESQEMLGSG